MVKWSRVAQSAYICFGYLLGLTGAALGIAFIAMHGSKFGAHAIPITKPGSEPTWVDGPPEFYLFCFWLFTCMQVVLVVSNVLGPCSCEHRAHFCFQSFGVICNLVYLIMANTSLYDWPDAAQVWNPRAFFMCSAIFMLIGQTVLAWGAWHLSGSGCSRRAGMQTREDVARRMKRLANFNPVWHGNQEPGRGLFRYEYEGDSTAEDEEWDEDDLSDAEEESERLRRAYHGA